MIIYIYIISLSLFLSLSLSLNTIIPSHTITGENMWEPQIFAKGIDIWIYRPLSGSIFHPQCLHAGSPSVGKPGMEGLQTWRAPKLRALRSKRSKHAGVDSNTTEQAEQ